LQAFCFVKWFVGLVLASSGTESPGIRRIDESRCVLPTERRSQFWPNKDGRDLVPEIGLLALLPHRLVELSDDAAGRNVSEMDALGRIVTMAYNQVTALLSKQDPRNVRVTYTYDATDRQTRREYTNDLPVTITYDDVDNPTLIQDGIGRWTMTYDSLNRVQVATDPMGNRNTYTLDAAGQRTVMATAAGRFAYTHDAASRLATIHNPEGERTTYTYDAAGREILKQFNTGSVASTVYDAAGQVIALYDKPSGGAAGRPSGIWTARVRI
jgi:YD repeat-containing protein